MIPIDGEIDFDDLVERFENLADEESGDLIDDEMAGKIEYQSKSGLTITVNTDGMELVLSPSRNMNCLELIDKSIEGLLKISKGQVKLLK